MTVINEQAAAPVMNGAAPPPDAAAGEAAAPGITIGERLMGVIGIAFAAGLLLIGLDLMTGGAISRTLTGVIDPNGGDGAGAGD